MVRLTLAATVAMLFAMATTAHAAETIGSDLVAEPNSGLACISSPNCTYTQTLLPGRQLASSIDGVIVRWRFKTSGPLGPVSLRVLRPNGAGSMTGISTLPGLAVTSAGVSELSVRVPIAAGDKVGLDKLSTDATPFVRTAVVGSSNYFRHPQLADGATELASAGGTNFEMLMNATIEPDVDRDGFGDESQDSCPALAGQSAGCPVASPAVPTVLIAKAAKRQRLSKLAVSISSNNLITSTTRATATTKFTKTTKLRGSLLTRVIAANSTVTVKPKFSSKTLKKLKRQLAKRKKVTVSVVVSATDSLGPVLPKTVRVTLKR